MQIPAFVRRFGESFSYWGLVVATLFYAFSLTPSLLPRPFAVQGLLSGVALAVGYGVGVIGVWLWKYLELRAPGTSLDRLSKRITAVFVAGVVIFFSWRATIWQNSIRRLMEMPPVETAYPWRVVLIAVTTAAVVILASRGVQWCWYSVHRHVNRVVPRRVSYVLTTAAVVVFLLLVINRVFARVALDLADSIFLHIDKLVEEDVTQPSDPLATGSRESLVDWDSIGLQGKNFIVTGPTSEQIGRTTGREARQPLRVYVGLRTKDSILERAELALQELQRIGGFERSVLVVATPTGTGWLDPGAVDTVEYLHRGDTAIVSIQYSYLPSWLTILVDPHRSRDSARALFDVVYDYWKSLPKERRPKIYLHGLSLGSLGSETSADLFTVFEDPIQGGVWSGPPFPSTAWARATRGRNSDSPVWRPEFRDGSMLRFMGRDGKFSPSATRWGPMRFVYIQHASDPMIFFSSDLLYRRPAWLVGQRGPDVSPYLRWVPIVMFLQTAFDLPMATSVPIGYGHNYAPESYIDAWRAVSQPSGWSDADILHLKRWFASNRTTDE